MKDTKAAKDLLYRRLRCLADYEAANKNLERSRAKNKDVAKAELGWFRLRLSLSGLGNATGF